MPAETEPVNFSDEIAPEGIADDILLQSPHSRMVGGTEYSWCKALGGGTGITILALYFEETLDPSQLQEVVHTVQRNHPRLRSQLVWIDGKPAFCVCQHPYVEVEVVDPVRTCEILSQMSNQKAGEDSSSDGISIDGDGYGSDGERPKNWMYLVEHELNTNAWSETSDSQVPKDMLFVRFYHIQEDSSSLAILRIHTSICDRVSAATILKEMLHVFYEIKFGQPPRGASSSSSEIESCELNHDQGMNFMSIEDAIPKGKADKPFWAHGLDLLGYSLGSKRHSNLPFEDPHSPRHSQIIRLCLSSEETTLLQNGCRTEGTTISAALTAAGLKATAVLKEIGNRAENYAVITLIDCRSLVDNNLSDHFIGFYHSAIINTYHINEAVEFWELARRCSNTLDNSIKNRKHFTDMSDVTYLMCQAIEHPSLTPSSSLRTSLIVVFQGAIVDEISDLEKAIGLRDYMGCSSVHGVGPSIAIFDTIRNGALDCACVYPAPLHSRKQVQKLVNCMKNVLVSATAAEH